MIIETQRLFLRELQQSDLRNLAKRIGMCKEEEFITRYHNGDMLHFLYSVSR